MSKREKAQYFLAHPDKVAQHDQRAGHDPCQHCQINVNGHRYALLMVAIQGLHMQVASGQPQGSSGPKAYRSQRRGVSTTGDLLPFTTGEQPHHTADCV